MKPDSMLVEPEHIVSARREVASIGSGPSLNQFAHQEPALASFLSENLASFAGRLSLSGAPTELVQGSHEEVLTLVLTCVQLYVPRPLRFVEGHHERQPPRPVGTVAGVQASTLPEEGAASLRSTRVRGLNPHSPSGDACVVRRLR